MRILFFSDDLIGGNISYLLKKEGHEVKLYIDDTERKMSFTGLVTKTDDWEKELGWVGKDGLIVFDSIGEGRTQDKLRAEGYNVFGSGLKGEELETDRQSTLNLFENLGMDSAPVYDFSNLDDAIQFVEKNPDTWVIKKNDVAVNSVSYVGHLNTGEDVIDVLRNYKSYNAKNCEKISLQRKIAGVEIAIARYFNGTDWVSPIEINIEHNPFLPGDIGLSTSEMGTLGWYTDNEESVLFQKTLARLKPYLAEINYRGVIDINCIVNEEGVFPLEVTARMGSPIVHFQTEMLLTPWSELLMACAAGSNYTSKHKKGYGLVVFITTPPFPYAKALETFQPFGQKIYLKNTDPEMLKHIHFEDVSFDTINNTHFISDSRGYILYVTAQGSTFEDAQALAYERILDVYIPKMMYRNDIGTRFIKTDRELLEKWGYLK